MHDRGGTAVFYAMTGSLLTRIELPDGVRSFETTWEDDRHVLLPARSGRSQTLVRVSLDGALTRAGPIVPADRPGKVRFVLANQP